MNIYLKIIIILALGYHVLPTIMVAIALVTPKFDWEDIKENYKGGWILNGVVTFVAIVLGIIGVLITYTINL